MHLQINENNLHNFLEKHESDLLFGKSILGKWIKIYVSLLDDDVWSMDLGRLNEAESLV